MIYIIIFNNSESYEDYSEYIAGVFVSIKLALEYGIKYHTGGNEDFAIEQWSIKLNKKIKTFCYDNGKLI